MVVLATDVFYLCMLFFFFQAEDGIRYLVRSRGLGDVYKRQPSCLTRFPGSPKIGLWCAIKESFPKIGYQVKV